MNSERGFVTVFALCLIVVVALVVKGIQESDANRNYSADAMLAESALQSAVDGGIYEAAEKVRVATESGRELLPASIAAAATFRRSNQKKLVTRSVASPHGTIRVEVWGERFRIKDFERTYNPYKKYERGNVKYGYMLIGAAQLDSPRFGKMYRRALAYVVDGYGKNDDGKPVKPGEEAKVTPEYETVVVADQDKDVVHFTAFPSRKES